ncbi:MAG: hypothetical protein M0Z54_07025 [Thermaerobacter sp.]|nr:hypothetical protein [Thermaerobacter sp.]
MSAVQRLYQAWVDAAEAALREREAMLAAARAERDGIAAASVPGPGVLGTLVSIEDLWGPARFEEANQRRRLIARARVAEREQALAEALQRVQGARRRLAMAERLAARAAAAQERLTARRESLTLEDNWRTARAGRRRQGERGG